MKVSVNQRSIFLVILAMIFLLALLNGLTQSEQSHQKIAQPESKISHPVIKSPEPNKNVRVSVVNNPLYINHASVAEIAEGLKGVGEKIAQRIVNTRKEEGDFTQLEDLLKVSGMGSAKIQANKEIISFDSPIPKE